tara:strand:- start:945 stop:1265 length:321 start_codon:yes stop_codon:yes gene_type:complete
MSKYHILDGKDGAVINTIKSDEEFVKANYSHYKEAVEPVAEPAEEIPVPTAEEDARAWRDKELAETDFTVQLPDHPNRDNVISYRVLLREWPSTADFPLNKPVQAT